ncbi:MULTISPECIES: DUF2092 domain-containing protein [unclassified Beijerinckia]|uniref:DUF2092 domain-containing protein n=1 Tax=unclassified Beijerinckia TaxID=2638183 RepID=UPI000898AED5|nr:MULTISPECIES: DUF2092 domain-containing protein [unclassified Beijerinckia]MDH7799865.1 hypothetical protein [Beijerinckia sp. GAS462]SED40332.1 hypothetical protein SAMN05443249_5283 [Beijerinckia sp. 28-YEA-48]
MKVLGLTPIPLFGLSSDNLLSLRGGIGHRVNADMGGLGVCMVVTSKKFRLRRSALCEWAEGCKMPVRREWCRRVLAAILSLTAVSLLAPTEGTAQSRRNRTSSSTIEGPRIDPNALAALAKMGGYLRSLSSFELNATTLIEVVLDNGQKIGVPGTARYRVVVPNKLRIDVVSEAQNREFIYDGKTFTFVSPRERYYAQADAPPTIKATLELAAAKYGIELPFADLFLWGTDDAPVRDVFEASKIGELTIDNARCEHWAFRSPGRDWEVCVGIGEKPLPLLLAIVNTADPAMPRFQAMLNWNSAPTLSDDLFTYTPAADAKRIEFLTADVKELR